LAYCIGELLKYKPEEIAVLVLHNKNKEKDVEFPVEIKRYFAGLNLDDVWIKYPWDADDIDSHTEKESLMLDHLKKEGKELYQ
jgi:hypoxanthine phosphoribosyltransferase